MTELGSSAAVSVLLSLGSNLEPAVNMERALDELCSLLEVRAVSRLFATVGVGGGTMPGFLNAAAEVYTDFSPPELKFEVLREVERRLGRRRSSNRNAPRTIDLDISLFGDAVVSDRESDLEIPDPEILTRAHVAVPLADLAPDRVHPVDGRTLREIARRFSGHAGVQPAADALVLKRRLE